MVWCKCLIEFTFFEASERAENETMNARGFAANWSTYQVSYPQSLWATFSFRRAPWRGARRSAGVAKTLLDAHSKTVKRTVTMLQSHNDSLSNPE